MSKLVRSQLIWIARYLVGLLTLHTRYHFSCVKLDEDVASEIGMYCFVTACPVSFVIYRPFFSPFSREVFLP